MNRMQQGFTLIELMIVVAIIGILAAIAIPAYQDYTKRAHVSEGLSLAGAAKTSVAEYYSSNGVMPSDNPTAGLASATQISGNAVKQVEVANSGVITITYNTKVVDNGTLSLSQVINSGSISWRCGSASTTMQSNWLPSNCR